MEELRQLLERLDGAGFGAYKELRGRRFSLPLPGKPGLFTLVVDHVQPDPFAPPSRARVFLHPALAALPPQALASPPRQRATRDFLARVFRQSTQSEPGLRIDAGGQTVLHRSACLLDAQGGVELRFFVELPAAGRRIRGQQAYRLLAQVLPQAVAQLTPPSLDLSALERHCAVVEDQVALRQQLGAKGLVAFVANGAVLPRRSGVDDRPLPEGIPWVSPPSLQVTMVAPNRGRLEGTGIPKGITLIVGGGFHGKSTLLRALEQGVYDHIPGDGRELVVTEPTAVKIRAEDGRFVGGVDISCFIAHLPYGKSTEAFTTELASGSTSQAAALVEALEAGAQTLLVDEDTSATNFMIRDARMQALVAKEKEPITPLVDRIRELREKGISTILVMGGSGDYLDHADTVIQMDAYLPVDVTARAHHVAREYPTSRQEEGEKPLQLPRPREVELRSLKPPGDRCKVKGERDFLQYGRSQVDLGAVEQLVDASQVRTVGWLLAHLARHPAARCRPLPLLQQLLARVERGEWDFLTGRPDGDLALPRLQEVMAALNRLRGSRWH